MVSVPYVFHFYASLWSLIASFLLKNAVTAWCKACSLVSGKVNNIVNKFVSCCYSLQEKYGPQYYENKKHKKGKKKDKHGYGVVSFHM